MSRLAALLMALCAGAFALSSPFLLGSIRVTRPWVSPSAFLTAQALETLVFCLIATWAGTRFAPRAALDAPWLRSVAERRNSPPDLGAMVIEAAAVGSVTAIAVTAVGLMLRSSVPEGLSRPLPAGFWVRASSAFHGGIIEETMVRWGMLPVLIAVLQRARLRATFWPANVLAALIFGALQLPLLAWARVPLTGPVVAYALAGNAIAGVVFGWMLKRRGLEGAMVAHGATDVWLHAALPALLA